MSSVIHGMAFAWNEWISPLSERDQAFRYSFRFTPGAFTDAITQTDRPMRLTAFDHVYALDTWTKSELASVAAGTLRYFEQPSGLMFEATLNSWDPIVCKRVYELIERGTVSRCCLGVGGGEFPPGAKVEIERMPFIGDLALILIGTAHSRSAYVRVGPAPAAVPFAGRPRPDLDADDLASRIVT
jgi:hypothetical protein